ncbi:MAG: methyltransferase domain-containing protein [Betaproteobacteria bacterium]|nr:methyltransferase domain-containing protein [Betaproteobacteria bacterium]
MGRWSARLAPLFVDFARVRDGDRALDVGCGTGFLIQLVADIAPRSQIAGIDLARPFVEFCRSRFSDPRIRFDLGSALELPYPDGAFDRSLSLLVFQHLPQRGKAALEMRRVTRAGGTAAACAWAVRGTVPSN